MTGLLGFISLLTCDLSHHHAGRLLPFYSGASSLLGTENCRQVLHIRHARLWTTNDFSPLLMIFVKSYPLTVMPTARFALGAYCREPKTPNIVIVSYASDMPHQLYWQLFRPLRYSSSRHQARRKRLIVPGPSNQDWWDHAKNGHMVAIGERRGGERSSHGPHAVRAFRCCDWASVNEQYVAQCFL